MSVVRTGFYAGEHGKLLFCFLKSFKKGYKENRYTRNERQGACFYRWAMKATDISAYLNNNGNNINKALLDMRTLELLFKRF